MMTRNSNTDRLSRRRMLRGVGTMIALPWLEAMMPRRSTLAAGLEGRFPLRIGFFSVPNGMHMPDWKPSQVGNKFQLTPTLARLADHRGDFDVLTGLTLDGAEGHGDGAGDHARSAAAFLTGAHPRKTDGADIFNGVSVDQLMAAEIGMATRFASLELGLEASSQAGNCDSGYSCAYASNMSWRGPTHPIAKEHDPRAVFDRLFAGHTTKETKTAPSEREKHRKSVLDFVRDDAQTLQGRLSAADRRKLDEFLYSVRDVEKRVVGVDRLRFTETGVPDYPRPSGVPRLVADHARLMMDMVALAFQTDSTRVVSFMFANEGSNRPYQEIGVDEGHHELSHHGKSARKQAEVAKINRFHVDQFGYLLSRLKEIREGEGTLLDQCLLVYGSGISDGDRHNHDDLPILLAGHGGGKRAAGRHLKYASGTPLCDLYLWMIHQAGINARKFGDSRGVLKV